LAAASAGAGDEGKIQQANKQADKQANKQMN